MEGRRGMGRADVVVLGVIMLLLGMLVPPLLAQVKNDGANRARCAANLMAIVKACLVYANENNDMYPYIGGTSATAYDATLKPMVGKEKADDTIKGIYKDSLLANNPYGPMWLLVLQDYLSPKQFVCKSDPFVGKPADLRKEQNNFYQNFQDGKNVSYSMAYMWQESAKKKGEIVQSPVWMNTTDASLPVISDMAPYLSAKAKEGELTTRPATAPAKQADDVVVFGKEEKWSLGTATSANHGFMGQNVAFADAHVEFAKKPNIGQAEDNIWAMTVERQRPDLPGTESAIDAGVLPAKLTASSPPFDIVMVPTRSAKGELK